MALEKLPVDEICDTLSTTYGLKIDKNINRNLKIVTQYDGSNGSNHTHRGGAKGASVGVTLRFPIQHACWENEAVGEDKNVVNIVFTSRLTRFVIRQKLLYDIEVRANDEVLLRHNDVVATLDTPTKFMFLDRDRFWDNVVSYADKVNEALLRDINRTKQAETPKQSDE